MMPILPAKDTLLAHANEYHATAELLQANGSVIGVFVPDYEAINCLTTSPRLGSRIASTILPFQRSRPGLAERHAPEVGVRRNEFESEDSFSFAISPRRHHFALHRLSRVLVEQNHGLVRSEFRVQGKQTPELADRLRVRAKDEVFAVQFLPVDAKRHRQGHARGAAPFDAPIVGNLNVHIVLDTLRLGGCGRGTPNCTRMLLRSRTSKKGCVVENGTLAANRRKSKFSGAGKGRDQEKVGNQQKEGGQVLGSVRIPAPARQRGSVSL